MISINCGKCKLTKGCEIKNSFRKLANDYEHKFKLKCPYKTALYQIGEKVSFTVGHGVTHWEYQYEFDTDWGTEVKLFQNKRYAGYVQLNGIVTGFIGGYDKFVISVKKSDFETVRQLFNKDDMNVIDGVDGCFSNQTTSDDVFFGSPECEYVVFVSKSKFIKPFQQ